MDGELGYGDVEPCKAGDGSAGAGEHEAHVAQAGHECNGQGSLGARAVKHQKCYDQEQACYH